MGNYKTGTAKFMLKEIPPFLHWYDEVEGEGLNKNSKIVTDYDFGTQTDRVECDITPLVPRSFWYCGEKLEWTKEDMEFMHGDFGDAIASAEINYVGKDIDCKDIFLEIVDMFKPYLTENHKNIVGDFSDEDGIPEFNLTIVLDYNRFSNDQILYRETVCTGCEKFAKNINCKNHKFCDLAYYRGWEHGHERGVPEFPSEVGLKMT